MKIITNYLFKVRRKAILSDLKLLSWKAYTTILFFFLFTLIIENIFYLSVEIRTGVLIILFSILLIFFIWLSIVLLKIYYNSFKKYNLSNLAKKVGSLVFSKHDTLLNAFQIESSDNQISSKELREQFIARTIDKLNKISFTKIFPSKKIDQWKKITFISLLISGLIILSLWNSSTSSMYRWSHPTTEFIPPKPFTIYSSTGHVNVLGGEDVNVTFFTSGVEVPDSLLIEFIPLMFNTNNDSMILKKVVVTNNQFSVTLDEVFQNYQYRSFYKSNVFWQPWSEISSRKYSISVTDRPSMNDFTATIFPPDYTKLPIKTQKANQAEIQAILGSKIEVSLKSNQKLADAKILLDENKEIMETNGKTAEYSFIIEKDLEFSIYLTDDRGISNRNPIPFRVTMINDILPEMNILQPSPIIELGGDQSIPIAMIIKDDFGFSNLQLA